MKTQEEFLSKVWEIAEDWAGDSYTFDSFQTNFMKAFNEFETSRKEEVDEELASLEDIAHGEIGNRITELRKKLK
jgi:hypothetical protein